MNIKSLAIISALIGTTMLSGCSNKSFTPCYVSVAECMKPNSVYYNHLQMEVMKAESASPRRIIRTDAGTVVVSPGGSGVKVYD